jgi:hypothetical protein
MTMTQQQQQQNQHQHQHQQRFITTHSQLPDEHRMVYEMCRKFADEVLAPNAREWDLKHEFPTDAIRQLVRSRLLLLLLLLVGRLFCCLLNFGVFLLLISSSKIHFFFDFIAMIFGNHT